MSISTRTLGTTAPLDVSVLGLVGLVRGIASDLPQAIHRTAMTPAGRKAVVDGKTRLALGPLAGGAIKLTTSRYYTPSGVSIHAKGITPDIPAEGPEEPPAG